MDRIILELQAELEDTYLNFVKILENANVIIATYNDDALGDSQVTERPPSPWGCDGDCPRCQYAPTMPAS